MAPRTIRKSLNRGMADPPAVTGAQVGDLLAFLAGLMSTSAVDLRHLVPEPVPSGLPVGD